jgi:hypothetical protein
VLEVLQENNITCTTFIHSYSLYGSYQNSWANEFTSLYNNEHIVDIVKPIYSLVENQDDILSRIPIDDYYTHLGGWLGKDKEKQIIRNLVLALYSKKQVTLALQKNMEHTKYDYVMIVRPELDFITPIQLDNLYSLDDTNIIIPEIDWYWGCNDRMMISTPSVALYYGTLYDSLLEYSRKTQIRSEEYLAVKLKEKNISVIKDSTIKYSTGRI